MENSPISAHEDLKSFSSLKDRNLYLLALHLSVFAGYLIPLAGLVVPIVMWQIRNENLAVDRHGKEITNFLISITIYYAIAFVLTFIIIGAFLFPVLAVYNIAVTIIAAVKAREGEFWRYPFIFRFIS